MDKCRQFGSGYTRANTSIIPYHLNRGWYHLRFFLSPESATFCSIIKSTGITSNMEPSEKESWLQIRKSGRNKFVFGGLWYRSALFISLVIFLVMWIVTTNSLTKDLMDALAYLFAFFIIRTLHRFYLWYSNEKKFQP